MIPCAPASWIVENPHPDEGGILETMKQRAEAETLRDLKPEPEERTETILLRFLRQNQHMIETAMSEWNNWVRWRHGMLILYYDVLFVIMFLNIYRGRCGKNKR